MVGALVFAMGILAFGGTAGAKPGPVVTRTASATAVGHGQVATATATCPKRSRAVGGGFLGSTPAPGFIALVFESQQVGQNAWRASSQLQDTVDPPDPFTISAFVYCRKRAPKTIAAATTLPTAIFSDAVPSTTANAVCPGRRKATNGGFATGLPISGALIRNTISVNAPASPNSWDATAVHDDDVGTVTSFAYCARQRKPPQVAEALATPVSSAFQVATATATCLGRRNALTGGFTESGGPQSGLFYPYESQRTGRKTWRTSAIHAFDSTAPTTLHALAHCG